MRGLNPVTCRRYYFYDHLKSVRAVPAEYGDLLYNFEYWPFGEEYTSSEFNEDSYRYTGHKRDYDLQLDYMISRYYNYQLGRFYQPDPVNGSIEKVLSWNLYTYVQNNPLKFTDIEGKMSKIQGLGKALDPYSGTYSLHLGAEIDYLLTIFWI